MKSSCLHNARLLALAALFCALTQGVSAQWQRVQTPVTANLKKLSFPTLTTGWAVGDSGTILKTTDAGKSWVQQFTPLKENLHDVSFPDTRNGYAISVNYNSFPFVTSIHKTTNGGATWSVTPFPLNEVFFFTICFLDSVTGFLGGMEGRIMRTADGGGEWRDVTIDSIAFSGFPILNMRFYDALNGFACGGHIDIAGVMWRTTNGGLNWGVSGVGPEPIHGFQYFSRDTIIAAGGDFEFGTGIIHTADQGRSWEYRSLALYGVGQTIAFRNRAEGWIPLGYGSRILYTADSGAAWQELPTPANTAVYDMLFLDSLTGYAACDTGIILRYNRGTVGIASGDVSHGRQNVPPLLFPNPGNGMVTILAAGAVGGNAVVYSVLGTHVLTVPLSPEGTAVFNAVKIPTGVYMVTVPGKGTAKFIRAPQR